MSNSIYVPKDVSIFGWHPVEFEYPPESELNINGDCSGELNGFFGKTHTKEAREAIASAKRRPLTTAHREAISKSKKGHVTRLVDGRPVGVNNKGQKKSDRWLTANEARMKDFQRRRSTVVKIDGIVYNSISQAAKALGRSVTYVRTLIKNEKALVIKPCEV